METASSHSCAWRTINNTVVRSALELALAPVSFFAFDIIFDTMTATFNLLSSSVPPLTNRSMPRSVPRNFEVVWAGSPHYHHRTPDCPSRHSTHNPQVASKFHLGSCNTTYMLHNLFRVTGT